MRVGCSTRSTLLDLAESRGAFGGLGRVAGVHQYVVLGSRSLALLDAAVERGSGAADGEHRLYGGGYEVVREAFCVDP